MKILLAVNISNYKELENVTVALYFFTNEICEGQTGHHFDVLTSW